MSHRNHRTPHVSPAQVDSRPLFGVLILAVTAFSLALAQTVSAHPDHGTEGVASGQSLLQGLLHPISGLDHLLAMIAVGVLAVTCKNRTVAWLTPFGFLAGMALGGVVGISVLSSVAGPGAELAIALSVILLGVLIGTVTNSSGWWLPMAAAVFGAFPGLAHGAELPARAIPVAYIAGFLVATALLHLAGTGIGIGLRQSVRIRQIAAAVVSSAGIVLFVSL